MRRRGSCHLAKSGGSIGSLKKLSKVSSKVFGTTCGSEVLRQPEMSMTLQPRAPVCPLKNRSAPFSIPADNGSSIAVRTRRHSLSSSYSMNCLYCQRRPSRRRHTRPRTRRPVMDLRGSITVQRCQISAPAGFERRVGAGLIVVNMEPFPNIVVRGLAR